METKVERRRGSASSQPVSSPKWFIETHGAKEDLAARKKIESRLPMGALSSRVDSRYLSLLSPSRRLSSQLGNRLLPRDITGYSPPPVPAIDLPILIPELSHLGGIHAPSNHVLRSTPSVATEGKSTPLHLTLKGYDTLTSEASVMADKLVMAAPLVPTYPQRTLEWDSRKTEDDKSGWLSASGNQRQMQTRT
ncbi:hypothetical protein RRG08_015049 [Elysia crispata]|uniref:Uncharacterized protein n=1 Tax=Elysia crispata TaxID=231223 RepID=A0AAE1B7F7_9GAST|nr:hypothetical protein RRG08_015049 [Elysia crispata]